jgi:ubiquitin carboxyl-terminal hydrolase 8
MNATIQCLSNIKGLSHNILLNFGTFDPERQPLCLAYSNLIYELLHTRDKYINPKLFKNVIGGLNPLFEGNQPGDAKDLIVYIIETLHKELLPPTMNNRNEIDFFQQEMDSNNEQIVLKNFITELSANQTIVSNIFYGAIRTVMVCKGCNRNKFSFQTFNLLIFPLKKVKDYKLAKMGGMKNKNLDLNLYDAFSCEQEVEKLEGENMIYCNFCRQLCPGTHKQDYYSLPFLLLTVRSLL